MYIFCKVISFNIFISLRQNNGSGKVYTTITLTLISEFKIYNSYILLPLISREEHT
jgi:hypothetical protein